MISKGEIQFKIEKPTFQIQFRFVTDQLAGSLTWTVSLAFLSSLFIAS